MPALPAIADPLQATAVFGQEPLGGRPVGGRRGTPIAIDLAVSAGHDRLSPVRQDEIDGCPIDALEPKFLAYRPLTTRPRSIPRLDPGPSEGLIVEHAELHHPADRPLNEIGAVAGSGQAATNLGDGA